MLDVADNLQRAAESVPAEALQGDLPEGAGREEEHEKALQLLKSLHVGVLMTDKVLQQVRTCTGALAGTLWREACV
jgi:hypothetical protein